MSGFVKFLFIKYSVGDSEFLYEQTTGDVCLQTHITVLLNKNFIFSICENNPWDSGKKIF